jgi:predicted Rossmann fold nucleotide-binding protein DprA/Smf involved in DNA uptake
LFDHLDPNESNILGMLTGEPVSVDQICRLAMMPVQQASYFLLSLEFKGLVQAMPGKLYTRTEN